MFDNHLLNMLLQYIGANTVVLLTVCTLVRFSNKKHNKAKHKSKRA